MKLKNKIVRFFVKYAVKTPIIYLAIVAVGISAFVILAFTTKVPVFETYSGYVNCIDNTYYITADRQIIGDIKLIFIYTDKNTATYMINNVTVCGNTVNFTEYNIDSFALLQTNIKIFFDAQVGSKTLFQQIFLNGGKD